MPKSGAGYDGVCASILAETEIIMSATLRDNPTIITRARGAIGKAFLVYLGTGSVLAAVVAYFLFAGMGC